MPLRGPGETACAMMLTLYLLGIQPVSRGLGEGGRRGDAVRREEGGGRVERRRARSHSEPS